MTTLSDHEFCLPLLELPANRTRRNYRGGLLLDQWRGSAPARDGDQPEDWIASTIEARNPGLDPIEHEGLATVRIGTGNFLLRDLFKQYGEHSWARPTCESCLGTFTNGAVCQPWRRAEEPIPCAKHQNITEVDGGIMVKEDVTNNWDRA